MTTLDSSSLAEEESTSMDNSSKNKRPRAADPNPTVGGVIPAGDSKSSGGEVWSSFTDSFRQVQTVLDRNRVLIQQVNENHQSKIHANMVNNVALIQEINSNISKVVSLYSDLSSNFSMAFHQRNDAVDDDNDNENAPGQGEDDNMDD